MKSTPSLSSYNRFEILTNICDFETNPADVQKSEQTPNPLPISVPIPTLPLRTRKPKWEKALPKSYIIAAMEENPTSLKLKVEIKTTDTAETKSVTALLDSSATGECIDRDYARSCQFNLINLTQPIPVYNVDSVMNDPPFSLSLHSFLSLLDPCQTSTSTSMLSPSSPTSSDLLYDSFYESFLFLAYDSFGLIA